MHRLSQLSNAIDTGSLKAVNEVLQSLDCSALSVIKMSQETNLFLLNKAICSKSVEITQAFLEKFPQVNFAPEMGKPPLHTATEKGFLDIVKVFLNNGADINKPWIKHQTPLGTGGTANNALHLAAKNNRLEIVKLFLELGADIEAKGFAGQTPLHFAAKGHSKIVKVLLQQGANVEAKDQDQRTPLIKAIPSSNDSIELLLNYDADLTIVDRLGNTPLHFAARLERWGILETLINLGCDVNAKNDAGETPLHLAVPMSFRCTEILLNSGADVDPLNKQKRAPLHFASTRYTDEKIPQLLLSRGADMYRRDSLKKLIPQYFFKLCNVYHARVLHWFLEFGFDINALLEPCQIIKSVLKDRTSSETSYLVRYIALLIAQNVNVDQKFLDLFHQGIHGEMEEFENCNQEIQKMKSTILEETSVSVFDILTRNQSKLMKLVRNENVVKGIEKIRDASPKVPTYFMESNPLFPLYSYIIIDQLDRGIRKKQLLEECNKYSHVILPALNYACVDAVFNFLHEIDLHQVIKSCAPPKNEYYQQYF